MSGEEIKSMRLTPRKWKRNGWIAVCKRHFNDYYNEERDGYDDAESDLKCDHKDCSNEAVYEIFPNLCEVLSESNPCIEIETGEDKYNIVLTDNFIDDLRKLEECEEEE